MPSAVFPRPSGLYLQTVSGITVPTGRQNITWTGRIQTRSSMNVGRSWTETYQPLWAGSVETENFISWLRWAWNTKTAFTVKHPITPGSGRAPNGTGSGGVTINASQTGSSIATSGWPNSTSNVVRAGDLLKIANVPYTVEVTDDANSGGGGGATISINPPIWTAPAGGSAITTTSVDITAKIMELSIPEISNSFYYDGVTVAFRESPA